MSSSPDPSVSRLRRREDSRAQATVGVAPTLGEVSTHLGDIAVDQTRDENIKGLLGDLAVAEGGLDEGASPRQFRSF
ncbi:hypothetical protein ColLi_01122 [Colletotrichum liriopes]|uniref:Uncharacterized protein n=1 Tax=Colletotrichum liriopes TaxID=708192 RepID=A0AA37GCB2_9PEZI|nr:hypothetical protein ColLi_01122 [Colletotrichum liriopes]